MGTSVKKLVEKMPHVNISIAQKLMKLDGHIILSRAEYEYRYNILDLHHKKHASTINQNGEMVPHDKEYAFGHIIIIDNEFYFSERPTENRDVEKHDICKEIYRELKTKKIHDIDRDAKLIDNTNVDFIVQQILSLRAENLIP